MKNSHQKIFFSFLCLYKMVDISVETWNKAEVSVINIQENDNANKTFLKLILSLTLQKDGVVKICMTSLIKKSRENIEL